MLAGSAADVLGVLALARQRVEGNAVAQVCLDAITASTQCGEFEAGVASARAIYNGPVLSQEVLR